METIDLIAKLITIVSSILTFIVIVVVKFNDIAHFKENFDKLEKKVDKATSELKNEVCEVKNIVLDHEKRISRVEGKINGKQN